MKQYGANKATEFSKKQIGVIYRNAKEGNLKVEKWFMQELYNAADYYGYDDNRSMENFEQKVLSILDLLFAGDMEGCQKEIDEVQTSTFKLLSNKIQKNADRNFV